MTQPQEVREMKTRFERSPLCRTIHADGAWGSLTPQLNVHMAIYSEHRALPDGTTIRVDADGTVRDEITGDAGVLVRQIKADVILSESTATALRNWLTDKINEAQAIRAQMQSPPSARGD
jgi:hypothetical protein